MAKLYKIHPLPLCSVNIDKGIFTYLKYYGQRVDAPIYSFLIEGAREPILVDTGCCAEEYKKRSVSGTGIKDIKTLEDSLKEHGLSLSDIKTIIQTHLDVDHILNAKKFPNARLTVQKAEMDFIQHPHPMFAKKYDMSLFTGLNFQFVSGEVEIAPGLNIVPTPGHRPGCQSVIVDTSQGKVAITGFCCIDENFSEQGDIVPGNHTDLYQAWDSNVKLRKLARTIIPIHSRRLLDVKSI